ncbi:MAG: D-glycerate dehydrogenase, partial [Planctomycetota bacterium]|nr:D-glycerate dehydrogenase [Planctomycetota bacterium]
MNVKPKIFLTRELPPETMALLQDQCELTMNREDRILEKPEIIAGIQGVDGLLCLLTDTIDADIMDAN